jgi:hypothetical protein
MDQPEKTDERARSCASSRLRDIALWGNFIVPCGNPANTSRIADNVCAGRSDIISTVTRYSGQQLAVTLALKADDYFYGSGILGTISFVS